MSASTGNPRPMGQFHIGNPTRRQLQTSAARVAALTYASNNYVAPGPPAHLVQPAAAAGVASNPPHNIPTLHRTQRAAGSGSSPWSVLEGHSLPRMLGIRCSDRAIQPELLDEKVEPKVMSTIMFIEFIGSKQVEVVVGSETKCCYFKLPEELLKWVSPFFKTALSEAWKTGGRIHLWDESPEAFAMAVTIICRPDYTIMPILLEGALIPPVFYHQLIGLASLGQYLLIPMLTHVAALNFELALSTYSASHFTSEHIVAALNKLEVKSELRKVIIEGMAYELRSSELEGNRDLSVAWTYADVVRDYPGVMSELTCSLLDFIPDGAYGYHKFKILWDENF